MEGFNAHIHRPAKGVRKVDGNTRQRVIRLIKAGGKTQKKIAELCGVSPAYVCRVAKKLALQNG